MTDRFVWNEDESVVIRPQPAIAIQGNDHGDLLLRQEGQYGISEDQYVDVRRENVVAVCTAMLREAGLHRYMIAPVDEIEIVGFQGNKMRVPADVLEKLDRITEEGQQEVRAGRIPWAMPARTPPKDKTAADRQRRRRKAERDKRDGDRNVTVEIVTGRDSQGITPSEPEMTPEPQQTHLKLAHG